MQNQLRWQFKGRQRGENKRSFYQLDAKSITDWVGRFAIAHGYQYIFHTRDHRRDLDG